jgi:tetratricopeptide (TPR) repeat protein
MGYYLGEVDNQGAYRCFLEGLELARRVGHRQLAREFVNNVGYTSFLTGDWERGLAELDATLEEDLETNGRIWLTSNALIIRASRGDPIDEALAELDKLATLVSDPHVLTAPHDTHANFAQAHGHFEDAQRHWLEIAKAWSSQAPASYYQAARPALWAGDLAALERYSADLDATGVHGPVVEARRQNVRAGLAALRGNKREALTLYKEALATWRDLKVTWEEALTGLDMATILDSSDADVQAAVRSTREIFSRLGAKPYLERLETVAARAAPTPANRARPVEASVAEPA